MDLSGGLYFSDLNYSHSIALAQIFEWNTGIFDLSYHVELVLKQIFGISEDVHNILLFIHSDRFVNVHVAIYFLKPNLQNLLKD